MKKWKREHNEACLTMLTNLVNNPKTFNHRIKHTYAGWLGAIASMIGHLAAATGNKAFVFQSMAEGMEEFDSLAAEKFSKKKFGKGIDKHQSTRYNNIRG